MDKIYNQMLACSVIVGNGSGVLIQPLSDTYTYILTAKHVITDQIGTDLSHLNQVVVENANGESIAISDCLIDPSHDIAILKTCHVIPSDLIRCIDDVKIDEKLHLLGYPNTRRNENNNRAKAKDFEGRATIRLLDNVFSITLDTQPDHAQLAGVSGCGVFREIEGVIYLCGIEFRVEGNPTTEYHGRIECVPLKLFDELIVSKSEIYAQILPPYLSCFSYVKEYTFAFEEADIPENVGFLKLVLQDLIQSRVAQQSLPTPLELYNKYKDSLLIYRSPSEDACNIKLWIALLEYLVITSLIDNQSTIDINTLEKNASKRKFLFSATEANWGMLLQKIFSSEQLKGLGRDGAVIIDAGRCGARHTPSPSTLINVINDIGRRDSAVFRIDAPIKNPAKEFKFYHWRGLHRECVIAKEDEYAEYHRFAEGKDATAVLDKIKDDYAQFLGQ